MAAAVILDTVADESRKKMADGVARSPSRLCSRDGKICCYGDALSTIFLLAFVPCFLFFVFLFISFLFFSCIPVCLSSCPFVCAATICYSQQVLFYSTCSFRLCHLYPTPFRSSSVFLRLVFFFVALISRVAFFFLLCSRTRYAST